MQVFPLVLGCPQYVDGKIPLLKTQNTLLAGYKEIELEMIWRLPRCTDPWRRRSISGHTQLWILSSLSSCWVFQNAPSWYTINCLFMHCAFHCKALFIYLFSVIPGGESIDHCCHHPPSHPLWLLLAIFTHNENIKDWILCPQNNNFLGEVSQSWYRVSIPL